MKTRIILRLALTALFFFVTLENKGIQPSEIKIGTTWQTNHDDVTQDFSKLSTLIMRKEEDPIVDDEEHEFLRFNFERVKKSRKYVLLRVVLAKMFLALMHVLMILSAIPVIIQIH